MHYHIIGESRSVVSSPTLSTRKKVNCLKHEKKSVFIQNNNPKTTDRWKFMLSLTDTYLQIDISTTNFLKILYFLMAPSGLGCHLIVLVLRMLHLLLSSLSRLQEISYCSSPQSSDLGLLYWIIISRFRLVQNRVSTMTSTLFIQLFEVSDKGAVAQKL